MKHLLVAGAGEQGEQGVLRRQAVPRQKFGTGKGDLHALEQGMADEGGLDLIAGKKIDLKVEQDRHLIDEPGHFGRTALTPCPYLRGDIIKGAGPQRFGRAGKFQIEAGIIDQHNQIRPARAHHLLQLFENPAEKEIVPRHLDKSDVGQIVDMIVKLHARRGHAISADAEELEIRPLLQQGGDQLAAVKIPRGLPGNEHHLGWHHGLSAAASATGSESSPH